MILISQDGLKAIDRDKIEFFYIPKEKNSRGCYMLEAKSSKLPADDGYYDFLILFEHENLEIVKKILRFLVFKTNSELIVDLGIKNLTYLLKY